MPAAPPFETVAILGLGLIGGSLGMALRERGAAGRVVGVARRAETAGRAVDRGAVDRATLDPLEGVRGADLVVLAAPVLSCPPLLEAARAALRPGAVVTDVGSTRAYLDRTLPPMLPEGIEFVGGHPMAGSERAGVEAARADLFEGATWVLTRPEQTSVESVRRLAALVRAVGARPVEMDAALHDEAVARISHLPHVAAAALAQAGARSSAGRPLLAQLAAGGFRDSTRIAASPPEMWRDICLTNAAPVLAALADFETELAEFRRAVQAEDGEELLRLFQAGSEARQAVLGSGETP